MTKLQFQADADLKHAIVTGILRRQPTIDFQSANAAGLEAKPDREALTIAAQDGILVTHDRKTMPTEFGVFITTQTSAGILILSQKLPIGDATLKSRNLGAIAQIIPQCRITTAGSVTILDAQCILKHSSLK